VVTCILLGVILRGVFYGVYFRVFRLYTAPFVCIPTFTVFVRLEQRFGCLIKFVV
jgi:hypothetical protein